MNLRRTPVFLAIAITAQWLGAGSIYLAQSSVTGTIAIVYTDSNSDVAWIKSTDGGLTWSAPVVVRTGSITQLACWYDRDSGISGDLFHCAYTESAGVTDTVFYRSISIETGTLSTETTIFAGTSTGTVPTLSIARMQGGDLICCGTIDDGTEHFGRKSTDVGANWTTIASPIEGAGSTDDKIIVIPGFNGGDTNDALAFFWDASADEISKKVYDQSGDTWTETSISGSMVNSNHGAFGYPHWSVVADVANSKAYLIAWNGVNVANNDLLAWAITEGSNTALTDVVTNGGDDQGLAVLTIDNRGRLWAFYTGKSDGSEIVPDAVKVYRKLSLDAGATWGAETEVVTPVASILSLRGAMHWVGAPPVQVFRNDPGAGVLTLALVAEEHSPIGSDFVVTRGMNMSDVKLADTVYYPFATHSPATGESVDADTTPVAAVYEDGTALAYAPSVTDKGTGLYHVEVVASGANGFEAGKRYWVEVSATVETRSSRAPLAEFLCVAAYPDDLGTAALATASALADVASDVVDLQSNLDSIDIALADMGTEVNEIHKLHGLDPANPLVVVVDPDTDAGTREAGSISQTIEKVDNVTTVERV